MSVTRQAPLHTDFPVFRVHATETFPTSYDAVAVLEEEHPELLMRNLIGKDGNSVLPKNETTFTTLDKLASDPSNWIYLVKLDPQIQMSKGIVMGYPLRMPTALLLRHPQVEEAKRCLTPR